MQHTNYPQERKCFSRFHPRCRRKRKKSILALTLISTLELSLPLTLIGCLQEEKQHRDVVRKTHEAVHPDLTFVGPLLKLDVTAEVLPIDREPGNIEEGR